MNGSAKYLWLNVVPTSGVENGSVAISGAEHTGRAARLFALSVKTVANDGQGGAEPSEPIVRSLTGRQEAAAMFLNLTQGAGTTVENNPDDLTDSEIIVSKLAGSMTISGRSNAQKLTISAAPVVGEGEGVQATIGALSMTPTKADALGNAYAGNAITITNGANIDPDYGLFGEYSFEVVISYGANNEAFDQSATITVLAEAAATEAGADYAETAGFESISKSFTLVQRSGDAYLWLEAENQESAEISLAANGSDTKSIAVLSNVSWEVVEA